MADRLTPGATPNPVSVQHDKPSKETVCIHTRKVYDSCKDKDCIEDLRVYLDAPSQAIVANSIGVRARSAELLYVDVNVEEVTFNRGQYAVDCRFFYRIKGEAYALSNKCADIAGLAIFDKRVILFGSEGNAKIFSSRTVPCGPHTLAKTNMPIAVVEAVDPIILNLKLADACECNPYDCECTDIPSFISDAFCDNLVLSGDSKRVYATLGQFTIIKLERDSQLVVPVIDYCLPSKECIGSTENDPCDLFKKIKFPVNEFFPPDQLCDD
jgi:hypothetical protein